MDNAPETSSSVSKDDQIIFVMGPTGAGKSTFIDIATDQDGSQNVGHQLRSYTSDIRTVRYTHPQTKHPIIFVDTPGFDDTYKTDTEVLSTIAEWLNNIYRKKFNLSTLLYLHRISDNRMSGSVLKNLRLFSSMCGSTSMPNTILVTTMWSTVKPEIGQVREEELKKTFWNEMIASGCKVLRFEGTKESAWEIVGNAPTYNPATIQISREMVDVDLRLNETQAGIELNKELQRLIKDRKVAMRQIQEQIQKGGNEITLQELNQRRADIDAKIELTASELRKLKIPFSRSIKVFFKKMGSGL